MHRKGILRSNSKIAMSTIIYFHEGISMFFYVFILLLKIYIFFPILTLRDILFTCSTLKLIVSSDLFFFCFYFRFYFKVFVTDECLL